ncbi:MAG: YfcL family protein [Rheinheimera sp.]|nr:YfcL family protein [Rheinheimera sp.]
MSDYFDNSVAHLSDDELFASGYLRGHVDLAVGQLQLTEQAFSADDIMTAVDASLAVAIENGELNHSDELLVQSIWQKIQAL